MTTGSFPENGWRPGADRWAGRIAEPPPALAEGHGESPQLAARYDPLTHPVAITAHCAIGDQIRVPAVLCAMAGCEAAFRDPAALGEADNRARAITAGWAKDALCRLVCPACQRDRPVPVWWIPPREPSIVAGDHTPAIDAARPQAGASQSAGSAAVGGQPDAAETRQHKTQRPGLLSALVSTRDGSPPPAGSRMPDAGTPQDRTQAPAPRHGQAMHAARSARSRSAGRRG